MKSNLKKGSPDFSKLNLAENFEMVKTEEGTKIIVEKAIEQIHEKPKETPKTSIPMGFKRIVADVPSDVYKIMKFHIAEDETSMRDYIANLIRKEAELRKGK